MIKNKVKSPFMLASLLAPLFISYPAFGEINKEESGFYAEIRSGMSVPRKLGRELYHFSAHKAPMFEIGAGYKLNDFMTVGLSAGMVKHKIDLYSNMKSEISSVKTVNHSLIHKAINNSSFITLDAYFNIAEFSRLTPFWGFGLGVARNKFSGTKVYDDYDATNDIYTPGQYSLVRKVEGTFTNSFAWKVLAGFKYKCSDKIDVTFNYSLHKLGRIRTGENVFEDDGTIERKPIKDSLIYTHNLMLGLRYNF